MKKYIFLLLILILSGCGIPKFTPNGDAGRQTEYFYGKKTCDYCKKRCGYFKVVNKKKIICADCYEKKYK